MHIEAIYDHGQVKFDQPIRFAKERFPIIVQIPDGAILSDSDSDSDSFKTLPQRILASQAGVPLLTEVRQILGPLSKARPPASSADDKVALAEALAEKYDQ